MAQISFQELALPKRNYRFEKHQKDLAKQRKKEEKEQRKRERAHQADEAEPETGPSSEIDVVEPGSA